MTFIEDLERSNNGEQDVGKHEDLMSKGKSASPAPSSVIPPSRKRMTFVVWECSPENMIITVGDVRFVV